MPFTVANSNATELPASGDVPPPDSPRLGELHGSNVGASTTEFEPASPTVSAPPPVPHSPIHPVNPANPSVSPAVSKAIDDVLESEIGVTTLLGRLKQCIATSKELANFFKSLAKTEDTKAKDLKHLARTSQAHRAESRSGTYGQSFEQVALLHERMANNSVQFSLNLSQMQEDLLNLAAEKERERKQWKQTGLSAESRAHDAEQAMEKARSKYNNLAEEYDNARTGDKSSRKINLRSIGKTNDQREEDLHQRAKAAEEDYRSKVEHAQQTRHELITSLRPQTVKALQHLIDECDSALTMQLQKFAGYSEQTLLKNGLLLAPGPDIPGQNSLRDHVAQIDNASDLRAHILSHSGKVPPHPRDITFEQHPVLRTAASSGLPPQAGGYDQSSLRGQPPFPTSVSTGPPPPSHAGVTSPYSGLPPTPHSPAHQGLPPSLPAQNFQRFDGGFGAPEPVRSANSPTFQQGSFPSAGGGFNSSPYSQAPPPQSSFPVSAPSAATSAGAIGGPRGPPPIGAAGPRPGSGRGISPSRRMFGLTLQELFDRDKTPVPFIVIECIQAVDHFGLDTEGIYRVSGNKNHVTQLREAFDSDSSRVDFRNPENFHHDVHVPAHLLKEFFRNLPDPLLTRARYDDLIQAARIEDDVIRRDNLHAIINDLPDPNYATLRALVLHLHRVDQHSEMNRMPPTNLAMIFGPTLMGPHAGDMALAGLQPRIVQTILSNALQIFDED